MAVSDQPMLYSVDFSGCATMARLAPAQVEGAFSSALTDAGATVLQTVSHRFPDAGLTCVLILAESHAVLHTWPETGTANVDIFSCSTRLKSLAAIAELGRSLGAASVSVREIPRADGHLRLLSDRA